MFSIRITTSIFALAAASVALLSAARSTSESDYVPVITPDVPTLEFTREGDVKVFHLVAEEVEREFASGMKVKCWGYNGSTPGPTIECVEGDRVKILVTNHLPEPTSVHWHGIILPNGMDGVAGLNQAHIQPGETWAYEFTLKQHGTFLYHPHSDEMTQMALGMMGFFVVHPKTPENPRIDRDFAIFPHEWFVEPGASRPNPMVMTDFNTFTFNSRAYPGTSPLVVKTGEHVRIRFANVSMDNHPIHIHGLNFKLTATDGGDIPPLAQMPLTTIDVPPGSTRDIQFVPTEPGDWIMHCHKTHHAMNAMAHDIPNMLGVDQSSVEDAVSELVPGYMAMGENGMSEMAAMHMQIPANTLEMMTGVGPHGAIQMGGMFTILKVRDSLTSYDDPGWYEQPKGTSAYLVSKETLPEKHAAPNSSSTTGAVYVCPMHPKITSLSPGSCPQCGMTLKRKP